MGCQCNRFHHPTSNAFSIQPQPRTRMNYSMNHFLPSGRIVEPGAGNGAFMRALPKGADSFEIRKGRDFLKAEGRWDWAVGNPPFSQFRAFLRRPCRSQTTWFPSGWSPRGSSGLARRTCGGRGSPWWSCAPCPSRPTGPVRHRADRRLGAPRAGRAASPTRDSRMGRCPRIRGSHRGWRNQRGRRTRNLRSVSTTKPRHHDSTFSLRNASVTRLASASRPGIRSRTSSRP